MKKNGGLSLVQNFSFCTNTRIFRGKTGLLDGFPKASCVEPKVRTNRVSQEARFLGFIALVLIAGFAAGCKSSPQAVPLAELNADSEHALVYFLKTSVGSTIGIWDGENPVGIIQDKEYIIHQVPAGTSYFLIDTAGVWRSIKAELSAGKTYYISFSFVTAFNMYYAAVNALSPDDPVVQQKLKEDTRVGFPDEWKKAYSDGRIEIVREELDNAKNGRAELVVLPSDAGK